MGIYKENGITAQTKCKECGETAKQIHERYKYAIEDGGFSEKKDGWVCGVCRESDDPKGTVLVFSPANGTVEKYVVKDIDEDDYGQTRIESPDEVDNREIEVYDSEKSPIDFVYVHTDAWRGYYEPKGEGWKVLHSDCILSMSEDAEQLKEFDTDLKNVLWKLGIEFAVAFGRTSNLFSSGYDVLIKTNQEQDIIKQMTLYSKLIQLTTKYRDPERFRMTALTGKSSGFDQNDKLLAEASKRLESGEDFETVSKEILEKAQH